MAVTAEHQHSLAAEHLQGKPERRPLWRLPTKVVDLDVWDRFALRIHEPQHQLARLGDDKSQMVLDLTRLQVENMRAAQAVALGSQNPGLDLRDKFPSLNAQQEWKQVLPADLTDTAAHNEDYERDNLVGATGWLLKPEFSGGDVPSRVRK